MLVIENDETNLCRTKDQVEFTFTHDSEFKFKGFQSKETQEYLEKWGMSENSYMLRFHYDQPLKEFDITRFINDFFNNPVVNSMVKTKASNDNWGTLGKVEVLLVELTFKNCILEKTEHSITSLDFFDVVYKSDIVRSDGQIKKCLDEIIGLYYIT